MDTNHRVVKAWDGGWREWRYRGGLEEVNGGGGNGDIGIMFNKKDFLKRKKNLKNKI